MDMLHTIRAMLHDQGLTIRGAQLALAGTRGKRIVPDPQPETPIASPTTAITHDVAALRQIRDRLRAALAA